MPSIQEILDAKKQQATTQESAVKAPVVAASDLVISIYFLYLRSDITFHEYSQIAKFLQCYPSTGSSPSPLSHLLASSLFSLYLNRYDAGSAIFKLDYKLKAIGSFLTTEQQLALIPLIEREKEKGYGNIRNIPRNYAL
jgi:hypothetical protein